MARRIRLTSGDDGDVAYISPSSYSENYKGYTIRNISADGGRQYSVETPYGESLDLNIGDQFDITKTKAAIDRDYNTNNFSHNGYEVKRVDKYAYEIFRNGKRLDIDANKWGIDSAEKARSVINSLPSSSRAEYRAKRKSKGLSAG